MLVLCNVPDDAPAFCDSKLKVLWAFLSPCHFALTEIQGFLRLFSFHELFVLNQYSRHYGLKQLVEIVSCERAVEHLNKGDQIVEKIWQIQRAYVPLQLLYDPIEVDLDALAKRIVADSQFKRL